MCTVLLSWWIIFLRVCCSICVCCIILILLMKTVCVCCCIPHCICARTHTHTHTHTSVRVEILSWFCFHVAGNSQSVISSWEVWVFWSVFRHCLPVKCYLLVWVLLILSGCLLSSSQICGIHIQLGHDFMVSHAHCSVWD